MTRAATLWTGGIAALLAVFGLSAWFGYDSFGGNVLSSLVSPIEEKPQEHSKKESDRIFNLICDGTNALPANGFDAPPRMLNKTFVAGIDLDEKTGWYQGQIALSETRKGTLAVNQSGDIVVSRPALFERYGAMITAEQFTLNRVTGEFIQSVTLSDKRSIVMIKAYCGKLIKPPF